MFSSLYQQSMHCTWCCEFPCSRGFSRNNHRVMDQILRGGTVVEIACCDTSSDGHPTLSCLVNKTSSLEFKKAQKQSKYLIPCLNNPTVVSVPHPAHVTLCGSRSCTGVRNSTGLQKIKVFQKFPGVDISRFTYSLHFPPHAPDKLLQLSCFSLGVPFTLLGFGLDHVLKSNCKRNLQ